MDRNASDDDGVNTNDTTDGDYKRNADDNDSDRARIWNHRSDTHTTGFRTPPSQTKRKITTVRKHVSGLVETLSQSCGFE